MATYEIKNNRGSTTDALLASNQKRRCVYAESTLFSKRESKSRLTQGIVMVCTRGINQDGVEVMSFERTMLIYKRRHSPEEAAGY